jgi:AcrR family transcriptional regulator
VERVEEEQGEGQGRLSRLPPGRHGLPREFVVQNQRERLAAGAIAAVAEKGFRETTVTDIAAAAGMSRRTFYGYFDSKEQCFFDTYGILEEFLLEAMAEAGRTPERTWPKQVRARIEALLEGFAANPDLVRFSLVRPPAAGGEFADRYRSFLERLVAGLTDGLPQGRGYREATPAARDAAAGALAAVLTAKVEAGEGESLAEIRPQVVELILTPFVGRKRAIAEANR